MVSFLLWWVIVQIFGLAALPLARRVFAWLPDQGYAFAKTTGLLLVTYLLWLGASAGIFTNTTGGVIVALLMTAGLSIWVGLARRGGPADLRDFWEKHKGQVLLVELLFLLTFAGWTLVRAYAPEKILYAGGEKFMEIALLNGVLNSPRFPPLDPWLAGHTVSYYYFGYVMMGVMARLSGAAATISFDLYDALTFALTAVGAYGVVANMVAAAANDRGEKNDRGVAAGFGLLGALFVTLLGNLDGLLEGLYSARLLPAGFWEWIDIPDLAGSSQSGAFYPGHGWWWWRASRVLRDLDLSGQPALYQPIDEFPFFSFLLGDNHPHKLALPFVLLVFGLAFNLLLRQRALTTEEPGEPTGQTGLRWIWTQRGAFGLYAFYALALGSLLFLNTWDFPTGLGLVLLAFAGGRVLAGESIGPRLVGQMLALGVGLSAGAALLYLFFFLSFSSQASGVLPYAYIPTRLPQYLVMFGPFLFILAFLIVGTARRSGERFPWRRVARTWAWMSGLLFGMLLALLLAAVVIISGSGLESSPFIQTWLGGLSLNEGLLRALLERIRSPWLYLLLSILLSTAIAAILPRRGLPGSREEEHAAPDRPATLFALLLGFAGLALTLVVEFVYLRDNFGMRMNTIFKFYYQAWVLMACASAYGAWWVSRYVSRAARTFFSAGAALLTAAGLVYPVMGIYSRVEGFANPPNLNAAATFAGTDVEGEFPHHWAARPDDWAAIVWLRHNGLRHNGRGRDGSVPWILEATTLGYDNAGRISAFTGFPTLLGWSNHEFQWRGDSAEIDRRIPVIRTIYTTASGSEALNLLREWQLDYVIVGDAERFYINHICEAPETPCDPAQALAKFDTVLTTVFTQGSTIIYQVPEGAQP